MSEVVRSAEDEELMRRAELLLDGANVHEGRSRINLLDGWYCCQRDIPDGNYSEEIREARVKLRCWIAEQKGK